MSEHLAARIAALEAGEEIQALKARYWRGIDLARPDEVQACLDPEVSIDFDGMTPFTSRADFLETVKAAVRPGEFHMHHGQNPVIELLSPNMAQGKWDVFYLGIFVAPRLTFQMAGTYEDRYVRREGRWWIAAMTMRKTSFLGQAIGPDGTMTVTSLPVSAPANSPFIKD